MKNYLSLLQTVLETGDLKDDRTGVGTLSKFGLTFRHRMSTGFPLLTTKKMHWKAIVHELLWFLRGDQNLQYLKENGVTIWDEWADEHGNLGPIYGYQWRSWPGYDRDQYDQIARLIFLLRDNPDSRRQIVSSWNVAHIDRMGLPPCHLLFQTYVSSDKRLSLQMYQRSADLFLGVPFNIASYGLLLKMLAHICDLKEGELIIQFGDIHIYRNHVEQVREQLGRYPNALPEVSLNPEIKEIDDFKFEDISLIGYNPAPAIKAPIAV